MCEVPFGRNSNILQCEPHYELHRECLPFAGPCLLVYWTVFPKIEASTLAPTVPSPLFLNQGLLQ